ncbi:hypothetical protein RJ640_030414 [Escallonia rubra]|uniref:Uncharacterized protein n=1 Tax=Escallonia rubra TaxID=112253 RepID=A0AA88U0K3_9ASTE|nr:hypothetical protein RJ640_030414 [Escallonia rubra]
MLKAKMSELRKTKEDLKQVKDDALQSWLDSRPLLYELDKLQTGLGHAKHRSNMSKIVISELESQLEATNSCIRSKSEEELKDRTLINDLSQVSFKLREEMEQFKLVRDDEHQERSKLKQVLRLRRQTLRTLQLTLRAIRSESEALSASAAEALLHIKSSQVDNTTVQLTHEEYYTLTRRAREETSLADWRVSVSAEQRHVVEKSRHSALRRLKEEFSEDRSRRKKINNKVHGHRNIARNAEEDSRIMVGDQVNSRHSAFPTAPAKPILPASHRNRQRTSKIPKSRKNRKVVKKKETSICVQIKSCLVRNVAKMWMGEWPAHKTLHTTQHKVSAMTQLSLPTPKSAVNYNYKHSGKIA